MVWQKLIKTDGSEYDALFPEQSTDYLGSATYSDIHLSSDDNKTISAVDQVGDHWIDLIIEYANRLKNPDTADTAYNWFMNQKIFETEK